MKDKKIHSLIEAPLVEETPAEQPSHHQEALTLPPRLLEAVETLAAIARLEVDQPKAVAEEHTLCLPRQKPIDYQSVLWLHNKSGELTIEAIQTTFGHVLNYLHYFYEHHYNKLRDLQVLENVRTIMVLVTEAAKQLEKMDHLFIGEGRSHTGPTELKEYRQLQQFYLSKIAPRINEGKLGKWAIALSRRVPTEHSSLGRRAKRGAVGAKGNFFLDLNEVRQDSSYELFYLRKEDGSPFFDPHLLRNIKMVCEFSGYLTGSSQKDPLSVLKDWQERYFHRAARQLREAVAPWVGPYFEKSRPWKNKPLVATLNQALLALFLAADDHRLADKHAKKGCSQFFFDFQQLFRSLLRIKEFYKLTLLHKKGLSKANEAVLQMAKVVCRSLYGKLHPLSSLEGSFHSTFALEEESRGSEQLSLGKLVGEERQAIAELLLRHSGGPLEQALAVLSTAKQWEFDPLLLGYLPDRFYTFLLEGRSVDCLRIASPTRQEYLQKAAIADEFRLFLVDEEKERRHLLFVLQERTLWKDQARCRTLESLTHLQEVRGHLEVVTLPIDNDFYHQREPYHLEHQVDLFRAHFLEHQRDELTGYHFEKRLAAAFSNEAANSLFDGIHQLFFEGKNVIHRGQRLLFIDLYYLFMALKMIELSGCSSFSFTCKDGLDLGAPFSLALYVLMRCCQGKRLTQQEREKVLFLLLAPPLLHRERPLLQERCNRWVELVEFIESHPLREGKELFLQRVDDRIKPLFATKILESDFLF